MEVYNDFKVCLFSTDKKKITIKNLFKFHFYRIINKITYYLYAYNNLCNVENKNDQQCTNAIDLNLYVLINETPLVIVIEQQNCKTNIKLPTKLSSALLGKS